VEVGERAVPLADRRPYRVDDNGVTFRHADLLA
jgi:hypothetical protein